MKFDINKSIEILERTPVLLRIYLQGLSEDWIRENEGPETWSPYDVLGHLIHGEKTDWIPRMKIILEHGEAKAFIPFDRFAQFEESKGKTLELLLDEFERLRKENLDILKNSNLLQNDLEKSGLHPELGPAKLRELLATWTVHDLGHIAQISRCMAKQYKDEVGVWTEYLGILKK